FARRGLHPGAVHGRHRRAAAPRVRCDDRRRDLGVGHRLGEPHADAVQPVPEAAAHAATWPDVQRDRERLQWLAEAVRLDAARAQRKRSVDQIMSELRPKVAQIPGVRVYMVNQPPINLGGQQGARSLYQFTLQDTDTAELYKYAPILEQKVRELPGIEDVSSDLQVKNPQVQIDLNREKIAILGLTVNQVETALYNAYGTRQVSQIFAPNNQYQVIMQVAPEFQRDPSALSMLYVRSANGGLIPLD